MTLYDVFMERAEDWWHWANVIDSSNHWMQTRRMMQSMGVVASMDGDHSLAEDLEILVLTASERMWWKLDEKLED